VTGLRVTPESFTAGSQKRITISFILSQRADITVCVLDGRGALVHQLARPNHASGPVSIRYAGHAKGGQLLGPGRYRILIVASNAKGSAATEAEMTVAKG
jgi:flagellar hook assembly protein FlgD